MPSASTREREHESARGIEGTSEREGEGGRTLELLVEAGDARRDREVDRLVAKVDDEATEDGLVDAVLDDEVLAGLGDLGALERVLDALLEVLVERDGRRDDDLDLAAVGAHDVEEAVDDAVRVVQAAVLGEDGKEVAGEVGRALGGGRLEEGVDAGRAVVLGQDRVGEELVDLGVSADGRLDALEVGLDSRERAVSGGCA